MEWTIQRKRRPPGQSGRPLTLWSDFDRLCPAFLLSAFYFLLLLGGGFGVALVEPWGGFRVALGWLWSGFRVALGWLWGRNRLAINTLWGGFDVALGGFARLFRIPHSPFRIRPMVFAISSPNTTRLPRLPRGVWGHSGTIWYLPIPIEHCRSSHFDQASLSKLISSTCRSKRAPGSPNSSTGPALAFLAAPTVSRKRFCSGSYELLGVSETVGRVLTNQFYALYADRRLRKCERMEDLDRHEGYFFAASGPARGLLEIRHARSGTIVIARGPSR
jgi:hypothetical protein